MVQRLTSRSLVRSCWLTPFDCSVRMYSRCCSVRLGRRSGKRPSARAFACPATEGFLIKFRHRSLRASTIESWSLPVGVALSKSYTRCLTSTTFAGSVDYSCWSINGNFLHAPSSWRTGCLQRAGVV